MSVSRSDNERTRTKGSARDGRWQFKILGMDCAEEVAILKRAVGPLVGSADHLSFDLLNGRISVARAPDVSQASVIEAVRTTGCAPKCGARARWHRSMGPAGGVLKDMRQAAKLGALLEPVYSPL